MLYVHQSLPIVKELLLQYPMTRFEHEFLESVISCTTALRLKTSPLGRGTYSSASRSNSVAYASDRPIRFNEPLFTSMYITSPISTFCFCNDS
ncbi:hypothetical protein DERF_010910 [Dermatophagoides farinae]|uniref:Uncharacterized protein n=1 Tax=Dermatophagoides farinae TaxID=6954 RepID=A0A922L154_DERFA|nr:hypothetical protein DERF_010910 [Dermatophagoides farinae]